MGKNILTEYRPEIGTMLLILMGLASMIGLIGSFVGPDPGGIWGFFRDLVSPFGAWVYWLTVFGILGFVVILWWDVDYILKVRKLRTLLDTSSKSKLIKNLDDIEYIAWRLPKKYKILVGQKKMELKVDL